MFVPDKALAAREVYRVLKRDGVFLFNVWDALKHNKLEELAHRNYHKLHQEESPNILPGSF
jgi:ubiquinone/menaquinone biosynthesis C-methylase UbiE